MRFALILAAVLLTAGCVNITAAGNYVPRDNGRELSFYACQNLNGAGSYNGVDYSMVYSCMESRGYRLGQPPWEVVAIEVVTSPVWLPLDLVSRCLGMGGIFTANMAVADGPSE
jgi:hypothetical protein